MERVKRGEKYWHIGQWGDIHMDYEEYAPTDDWLFQYGNYFHSCKEAEAMAKKLRAVLKGADVIEMPSDEECKCGIETMISEYGPYPDREDYCAGFWDCINWLKSKIVK